MRAAVNYTAGKYACFCLKIHQECSEECVVAVVVVFAQRQGIAPPLPFSYSTPRLPSPAAETHPDLSLLEVSGGKLSCGSAIWGWYRGAAVLTMIQLLGLNVRVRRGRSSSYYSFWYPPNHDEGNDWVVYQEVLFCLVVCCFYHFCMFWL